MRKPAFLLLFLTVTAGCRRSAPPVPPPAAPATYEDVTAAAGVHFRHFTGADGRYRMPESLGPGCAFIDYDGDGWQDLYLVNSSNWPDRPAAGKTGALYRNQRDGTFREVTREAGLAVPMYGQGCAVGDFDNDGREDLLVTCLGPNHLFHNLGGGKFRETTHGSGLDDSDPWAWHTSAAWLDYDRDGRLDLFVCRYVKWSPQTHIPYHNALGKLSYGGPVQYSGDASELYRNLGNGKFRNVSAATGIHDRLGKGLGVVPLDVDGDGRTDLLVTNDLAPNHLWRNEGGKRFREVAQEVGLAVGANGQPRAGMGVDAADVRNDGGLAFAVGNFAGEGAALFVRDGLLFTDQASTTGLVPATTASLTFGLSFLDADGDGWNDLFLYNGHIDPYAQDNAGKPGYRQRPQLFQGKAGAFQEVTDRAGSAFGTPQVGRGSAVGDWNNDGRPDLLLSENDGPAHLWKNATPGAHHWLGVRLIGTQGNRNGYGAEVRLTAGGRTQRRWVRSGSSYLSHSDSRALFGLGSSARIDRLEVEWRKGKTAQVPVPSVDTYMEVREGP